MRITREALWHRFRNHLCVCEELGLSLDISRMNFADDYLQSMSLRMHEVYRAMDQLEAGAIANVDEQRMVGHYWLRAPECAPDQETSDSIRDVIASVKSFAADVHAGAICPAKGGRFTDLLLIGIGGSALGPQFLSDALGNRARDRMTFHSMDNTDPDGIERTLSHLAGQLDQTLCLIISKSGGTPETRNGMLLARAAYETAGLRFPKHAVAITGEGSRLDRLAEEEGWLTRLPMWNWVGGRMSVTSAVGLLPAALQGMDTDALLRGAAACDVATRVHDTPRNPAALLALMWYHAANGRGEKAMVVLPYRDRLLLFSRYLQQLVMESLGKGVDLGGKKVEQGLTVYGNKGSTDQHAYVQQLREGVNNFFVAFIEVLEDGGSRVEVEPGVTAGDYLRGFLLGTREALYENGRESVTITLRRVDAFTLGALIALFERAVGFYATLVNINAYHQPGVEAGKKAAAAILELQGRVIAHLRNISPIASTAEQVAGSIDMPADAEAVHKLLEPLSANREEINRNPGKGVFDTTYFWEERGMD